MKPGKVPKVTEAWFPYHDHWFVFLHFDTKIPVSWSVSLHRPELQTLFTPSTTLSYLCHAAHSEMGGPRLPQKVALITGSSSGVGRAIALLFASEGTSLIVCADLKPEAAQGADADADYPTHELIRKKYGDGKAVYVRTDVGVGNEVETAVGLAVEKGGRLDMYVHFRVLASHALNAIIGTCSLFSLCGAGSRSLERKRKFDLSVPIEDMSSNLLLASA